MQYRIVIQFAKPEDSENWQTVAAPVFASDSTEEHVYARVRDMITRLAHLADWAGGNGIADEVAGLIADMSVHVGAAHEAASDLAMRLGWMTA